jgi:cytochrome c6
MPTAMRSSLAGWAGVLVGVLLAVWVLLWPSAAWGSSDGAALFSQHCAGCHVNGGNIIRRGKTLKLAALERQGLASAEAIAAIAANGVGQMGGYGAVLGEPGVEQVSAYVWQQALAGWPKG